VVTLSPNVRCTRDQYGEVILDIEHNRIFRLNGVGSLIVDCVKQGLTEPAIVEQLTLRYSVTKERAAQDVLEFLHSLVSEQLLRSIPESSGEPEALPS